MKLYRVKYHRSGTWAWFLAVSLEQVLSFALQQIFQLDSPATRSRHIHLVREYPMHLPFQLADLWDEDGEGNWEQVWPVVEDD